jgi:hypothetical protein
MQVTHQTPIIVRRKINGFNFFQGLFTCHIPHDFTLSFLKKVRQTIPYSPLPFTGAGDASENDGKDVAAFPAGGEQLDEPQHDQHCHANLRRMND